MSERPDEPQQLLESLLSREEALPELEPQPALGSTAPANEELDLLIDELETLFAEAKRVPFRRRVMIDEDEALDLVDRLRAAVPSQVRQARLVIEERDRVLEDAREEARRLLEERGLMAHLEVERERILARAEHEAERMRAEADEYVRSVLTNLDDRLTKLQASVRKGLEALDPQPEA